MSRIVQLIENDPRILMEVMAHLEPENRRRLIVTGGAMEWFGKESAAQEVEKADLDKDRQISPKDFDHWFESALKRKQEEQKKRVEAAAQSKRPDTQTEAAAPTSSPASADGGSGVRAAATPGDKPSSLVSAASEAVASASSSSSLSSSSAAKKVSFAGLALIALEAGLPFVGFGFLDNATMILAGDFIDGTIGFYLHCSVLASAAMGNVVSGICGMQVHGLIDKAVQKLSINTPVLSEEQMKEKSVFFAGHIGGTIGILIGLVCGMVPLLFLDGDTNEKADYAMFCKWDTNGSGFIELPEFEKALHELGFQETKEEAKRIMDKYGKGSRVDFEQFSQLKTDLREGKRIFD